MTTITKGKATSGFTAEERAAMRERPRELKAGTELTAAGVAKVRALVKKAVS
jgi:hypothetical protein